MRDDRLRLHLYEKVLHGDIAFSKIVGAMLPDLYISTAHQNELRANFDHFLLNEGDQWTQQYTSLKQQLQDDHIILPSSSFLESEPMIQWDKLQHKPSIRFFLLLHAYYHYHHHQFWRHYDFFEQHQCFDQLNPKQVSELSSTALLMCFYSQKTFHHMHDMYHQFLHSYQYTPDEETIQYHLQYLVLCVHYEAYEEAKQKMIQLEQNDLPRMTVKTEVDFWNICALYYYKRKDYAHAHKLLHKAIQLLQTSHDEKNNEQISQYLKNNKEKLERLLVK
ncbi:hypothetical protein [Longirhabdus pacifica]|uniref:hypothetical protein n=1 Tax=Longirhabdus pacifica TaxID=2305227 RepID=UPI001008CC9F|nr:hypothetical protein [Longirhabdus pacifica]